MKIAKIINRKINGVDHLAEIIADNITNNEKLKNCFQDFNKIFSRVSIIETVCAVYTGFCEDKADYLNNLASMATLGHESQDWTVNKMTENIIEKMLCDYFRKKCIN
jgi:hypothetical protein